jgi:hypothetical protein
VTEGESLFIMGADDGMEWGIPSKSVVAVRLHDPESSKRSIGFQFTHAGAE